MRVIDRDEFRKMPAGTLFAYGDKWVFSGLLVLHEIIEGEYFGFWAIDPMWVDADDSGEAIDRLEDAAENGTSYPSERSSSKYMEYDGDKMDWFLVLERDDIQAILTGESNEGT